MIRSLRKRLAALLIFAISFALLGASGAALIVSERQLAQNEQIEFLSRLNALTQDVRFELSVSASLLAKDEAAEHLIISIYDNGQPIHFSGGWQPVTTRSDLLDRVTQAAERSGVYLNVTSDACYMGDMRGDYGERYLAAVQTIGAYRTQRAVVMLMDMRARDHQRALTRLLFAGITLIAIIIMSVFSWVFSGCVVQPIAQAHANQNTFVSAASHEMRTPLQVMQSCVDALKNTPKEPRRFIDTMQGELDRMSRLSGDLAILTNAKGEMSALFGPVEPDALVKTAVKEYLSAANEKRLELKATQPDMPPPLIEGDSRLLCRALNILIDNAVCYTQPGGHISVSLHTERAHLAHIIQDDGPGIPPEHQTHIFERFYRADQSHSDRSHNGLGLCIAKEIVELHRGILSFENIKPHGSRFTIRLPRISPK